MSIELYPELATLNCPFCDGIPLRGLANMSQEDNHCGVFCKDCGANIICKTFEEAVVNWNRRVK